MTTFNRRKPVVLLGAASASLAMLSAETIAQPRAGPERPLAEAITQVLRGPFHGGHAPAPSELWGQRFSLPAVGSATSLPDHVRFVPVSAPGTPNVPVPAADDTPSRGKMFLLTTLAAAVGNFGTFYGLPLCMTATLAPGEVCVLDDDDVLLIAGHLATVAMTGGAAALEGGGFWWSQAASALGFAGGALSVVGIQLMGYSIPPKGFDIPNAVLVGVLSLGHAAITTLIVG